MLANTKIASELGFLKIPDGILIKPQAALKLPPERVAMLMTGSQGEPMAALPRLAVDNYKNIVIEPDDSVIISARIIPGNEKTISRMINHIYKHDAHVYTRRISPAGSRFGPRLRGRVEANAEPGAPEILCPNSW